MRSVLMGENALGFNRSKISKRDKKFGNAKNVSHFVPKTKMASVLASKNFLVGIPSEISPGKLIFSGKVYSISRRLFEMSVSLNEAVEDSFFGTRPLLSGDDSGEGS